MKKLTPQTPRFSLFSQQTLLIMISFVTLLLQMISFATTWKGAGIYLEDIFPYASLCFAIAIQATAYFFSNSLRNKVSWLRVIALCTALCCSTYYSYIGIYNSVNSPVIYLQENYMRISQELNTICDTELEETMQTAQEAVNHASSRIIAEYSALLSEQGNIQACRNALSKVQPTYTSGLRAPRQSDYETYEEYAAAYRAYISSASQGKGAENQASQDHVLSSYGYGSIDQLNQAEQNNNAALSALHAVLGVTVTNSDAADSHETAFTESATEETDIGSNELAETITTGITSDISALTQSLSDAIHQTSSGRELTNHERSQFNLLFQAAGLCGYQPDSLSGIINALNQCAQITENSLLKDYDTLVENLPGQAVTDANTMELKASMDAQIMNALIRMNVLLPEDEQLTYTDPAYMITDLYLIPIDALRNTDTRMTAVFCFSVAALIDALSVVFALSLRSKAPLWKKRMITGNMEDFQPFILASLPEAETPAASLTDFLDHFLPSPLTEGDGYMLQSSLQNLHTYHSLAALLCQLNLAKIIPAGFLDNDSEILLLKARFVFWANSAIYQEKIAQHE